jgi:predicted dinucleotide-binding enzyme
VRIGILGGGDVAQTLGRGLARRGHAVRLGIRDPSAAERARARRGAMALDAWAAETGGAVGTLPEAAVFGEVAVCAVAGTAAEAAVAQAGAEALAGKVLIDVTNPLDFSAGMPPFLARDLSGPTSVGERLQAALPATRVVKAFNTVTARVMVEPSLIPGGHDLFLAGDDAAAKATVQALAEGLGWTRFEDLGGIRAARAQEALVVAWVALWQAGGTDLVGLRVMRA